LHLGDDLEKALVPVLPNYQPAICLMRRADSASRSIATRNISDKHALRMRVEANTPCPSSRILRRCSADGLQKARLLYLRLAVVAYV
jgi:ribosomal protein L19